VIELNLTVLQTITGADIPSTVSLTFIPRQIAGLVSGRAEGRVETVASTRIIFLKHQNGDLQLSNVAYDMLPALNLALTAGLDALGAVIAEEGEIIGSPNSGESDKIQAISALGRCKDPRAIPALNRGLTDTSDVVRLEAVSQLAVKGDVNAILIAQSILLAPPPSLTDRVIVNLQIGIRDGARTSATAPEVAKLLRVNDKATREAAANALSHVVSDSIIEPLRQALSDPDRDVRYFAVVGLAKVTGQKEHLPNGLDFRSNEDKFTNYWRQWQPPE